MRWVWRKATDKTDNNSQSRIQHTDIIQVKQAVLQKGCDVRVVLPHKLFNLIVRYEYIQSTQQTAASAP